MFPLEKAFIRAIDPPFTVVSFQFNPKEYSVNKSVTWRPTEQKGSDVPPVEFVQGEGRTVNMTLFVDTYEDYGDAWGFVKQLEKLVQVDEANAKGAQKGRPPRVQFHWANGPKPFPAVIKSLNVTYTMFHPDGRPARANITLSMQEIKDVQPAQNPTSLGGAGRRSHRVVAGETLDLIAYKELGASHYWKHIAATNNLDNPLSLRAGQELVIIPLR